MSDTLQHDGKTYIEIGYLNIANGSAKRARAELDRTKAELATVTAERDRLRAALGSVETYVRFIVSHVSDIRRVICDGTGRPQ